jgi:signal transduction histidine kinase
VQIGAQDAGRVSRILAACAGIAVAVLGSAQLASHPENPTLVTSPEAALMASGLALFLLAPVNAGRSQRGIAYGLAGAAAIIGGANLLRQPATGVAELLAGFALAGLDLRLRRWRVSDPLLTGVAIIALVALVPRAFDPAFPGVMPAYYAGSLLLLVVGVALSRPEEAPLRTGAEDGPGGKVRRALPLLVAVPIVAALVSAFAARTQVGRPVAAVGVIVVLAALAVLALTGYLVRSLERADQKQRELLTELKDHRDFSDTLLQSMNEAVVVLDANHRVIDVNRRWRELTGGSADDPRLPSGGTEDLTLHRPDGTGVPVLATMAAIAETGGQPRGYVATYVDITERKRAEVELSTRAEELAAGNERLREANARLESALAFKNDLTSMLTHDVAQPVSSIASLAELLHSDWADLPDDIRLELVQKIDKNTHRLIKMMNDLQLLFRLDTGAVTARRTPVPLREVVLAVTGELGATGVTVEVDEDLSALADRQHVWHVVRNLVTNALAYGSEPVEVRAGRSGDSVVLVVQDAGRGIPEELVPNLFDRFMRGAGLGLFIVRHLVEANGGTVAYERATPTGARLLTTWEAAGL